MLNRGLVCPSQVDGGVVDWYKQLHREHLKLVCTVTKHGLPAGRFSGEVNDESTLYSLIIRGVQANDSGVYYCVSKEFSGQPFMFGNASKLLITGSPVMFLFTPPPAEISSMERVPLMCLVSGLSPHSLPIRWKVSGRVTEEQTDSGTIDPDGTYSIRSHISVSAETWSSGAVCTCTVQINSTENLISESVSSQRVSLCSPGLSCGSRTLLGPETEHSESASGYDVW
ncbi:immunoglobulin lambda-1 light chain-like [Heterodontus francisci]|uniref:immunoglobulin lambda-1 light chain-like n=1 Tax=Heterodontus francisci TaxID=7792 RepID=UPI00355BD0CF